MIKGLTPQDAIERLPFTRKRASEELKKVILTALANAKQKGVNPEDLIFKEIQVNEGPRLKRYRAGARGRAKPYKRRMSHIRIVLTEKEKEVVKDKKTVAKVQSNSEGAVSVRKTVKESKNKKKK